MYDKIHYKLKKKLKTNKQTNKQKKIGASALPFQVLKELNFYNYLKKKKKKNLG